MFGPSPLAGQVPGLGPVTPPRPEGSPRGPETPPPPRAMPPGPPTPPPPRPMSEQATRPTPPDPTGIFGPAPTPGGLPPGAAGTPGGAEWRGQSELDNTAPFQWDDPGLGLGGAAAAPAPSSSDNDWLNAPSGAAASFAAPAPSTESGFTYAPPTGGELGSRPLTSEASASPIPMAPEAPRTLPPAQPAKSGGISPTGLLLGVALVVIAILLALAFFRSPLFLNNNRSTPPETSVRQFLNAHFAGKWSEAAGYLASDQAAAYTADHQFAGLPTKAGGPVSTKGLAVDDPNAEVYATVPPAVKPYLFHLQKGADRWLITSGLPPAQ